MKNNKRYVCIVVPRTCAAFFKHPPGLQVIYDENNSPITVFCQYDSVLKIAMTLVMSFSRDLEQTYAKQSLQNDFPRKKDFHNWEDYRLPLSHMASIRDNGSTHWIYTCSYPSRGLDKIDYLRSKFSVTDILTYRWIEETSCTNIMEYINIRGKFCYECATHISQGKYIFNVAGDKVNCGDLSEVKLETCPVGKPVRYFGKYNCYSPNFHCTATSTSTTQLWFGQYVG